MSDRKSAYQPAKPMGSKPYRYGDRHEETSRSAETENAQLRAALVAKEAENAELRDVLNRFAEAVVRSTEIYPDDDSEPMEIFQREHDLWEMLRLVERHIATRQTLTEEQLAADDEEDR